MNLGQIRDIAFVLTTGTLAIMSFLNRADAYEAFGGFQIDNQRQYIAYGGFRASVSRPEWLAEPFFQVFAFRQNFFVRSEGQLLESQLNQLAPALGLNKSLGGLTLQFSAGPALRLSQEQNAFKDEEGALVRENQTMKEVGYSVTGYTSYTTEAHTFEGLLSYTNLNSFYFGRLRWIHYAFETERGIPINPGLELLAAGNSQFKEIYIGGLLGTEFGKLEILLKGGYQNNSTFHSGGYGGIELYLHF